MKNILGIFLVFTFSFSIQASEPDAILGFWFADKGKSKIEIYKCKTEYCGRIVWLEEPNYPNNDDKGMAGLVKVDRENENEELRTRPIVGLDIVTGFVFDKSSEYQDEEERDAPSWTDGKIYDPRNGKMYSCNMALTNSKQLEVNGYVGIPLFGRTVTWVR